MYLIKNKQEWNSGITYVNDKYTNVVLNVHEVNKSVITFKIIKLGTVIDKLPTGECVGPSVIWW